MMAFVLLAHRLIYGPQEEGALWTLFAVLFFFIGMIFLALGLIGEYAGRIYIEVRRRPTYIVRAVHGDGKPVDQAAGAGPQLTAKPPASKRGSNASTHRGVDCEIRASACCSRTMRWVTRAWRRC